ncbi:MAG: zf-TFIIB domain-containing protein [Terracidiphilus sp.]
MNCPSCGAPMKLKADAQSFKCEYCQSVYFPEKNDDGVRVLEEPSGHDCPVCMVPLMHAYLGKSPVIYCTKCNGMLIAMAMMEATIEAVRAERRGETAPPAPDKDDLRRKINCPQCHRPMDAHFYGGPGNVVIDSCEECSVIWLDRGEMMRIAHAPVGDPTSFISPSVDSDTQEGGSWIGASGMLVDDTIVDDIASSFFK